ncbi:MAG TPA: ABC transporter ATP-binding protein, partial [Tissierellaceae bacterium]|nr:ABC transporter ATP-binding protein [Tissierellaceae bacterium]
FEEPSQGKVYFEEKDITNLPPYKRQINTVFQKYALFPHLDIYENIAFGLKIKKTPKNIIDTKVKEMLKLVDLQGFEKREIESLSGGQQQRIAIARALVNEPEVLLLDEPLGALDLKLRKEMQIELKNMQKRLGITFIYVTHDQEEALTMSDTIAVMNEGRIQQIGTPIDIYNEPKNAFVAKFIGESNIIDGIIHEDFLVEFSGVIFDCVDKGFEKKELIDVVIRPEDLELVASDKGKLKGTVESVTFKGVHYEMIVKVDDYHWMVHSTIMKDVGTKVGLDILPENIHIMKKVMS